MRSRGGTEAVNHMLHMVSRCEIEAGIRGGRLRLNPDLDYGWYGRFGCCYHLNWGWAWVCLVPVTLGSSYLVDLLRAWMWLRELPDEVLGLWALLAEPDVISWDEWMRRDWLGKRVGLLGVWLGRWRMKARSPRLMKGST